MRRERIYPFRKADEHPQFVEQEIVHPHRRAYGCPLPHRPSNCRRTLGGKMWRLVRREWACSFRLRQQLFLHKQAQNGSVFMNIPPNMKWKAVFWSGFADGMSKPIPYSFVQPDTIQGRNLGIFSFRRGQAGRPTVLSNIFRSTYPDKDVTKRNA